MDKQHDLKNVPGLSTEYSTFPVLFSHGHGEVIGPPKTDDWVNLDDDSIFNPVLQKCIWVYLVLSQKCSETCTKDHPRFIIKNKT